MNSIQLFLSPEHECSYLENHTTQLAIVPASPELSTELYSQLIGLGFRRSGNEVYKPHCPACSDCISSRIAVDRFKPNRQQKRCWKKNLNTQIKIKPPSFDLSHYDLYLRYQKFKHPDGDMKKTTPSQYQAFLGSKWCKTIFVEFHIDNTLAAVAVVDQLDRALSAVYTFFNPDFAGYSPGVFAVLWQIEYAKKLQKDWLYLGFWIENCSKMSYKAQYQPLQGLIDNHWQTIKSHIK